MKLQAIWNVQFNSLFPNAMRLIGEYKNICRGYEYNKYKHL